jgi:hypothetical protein
MSDITVSSDIHTFMQSANNSAARDNLGVGDTDAVNHASLTLTGNAEAVEFIGDLEGAVRFNAKAGEALTKGDAVYVSGVSGDLAIVSKADSSNAATMPCFGLAGSTVNMNASVQIVTFGTLSDFDTSAFTLGDTLYVNGTGTLSATKPTGESNLVQNIGKVQRVHASAGSIKVGGAGRSNDTPNLNENKIFIGNSSNAASTAAIGTVITDNASSVKTSYESNSDTNAYTDAEKTKLSGIATGAEVNAVDSVNTQTGSVTLDADDIDDTSTIHKFATAAQLTKLDGVESGATADQTGSEIKSAYEGESNTNAFTDAEKTKLSGVATGAEVNAVDSVNTQTGAVVLDADDISDSSTTNKFTTASDISKLAGIEAGADVTDAANVSSAGAPIISSGAGTPSSTPSKVGDIYIDTSSDDAYISVGTASSSDWEKSNDGSGSGSTDLSWTASTSTVSSSTGTNATLTNADSSNAGLMSSSDKSKLDGIEASATADQTGAEIKTAYEGESDTNAFTDAEKTKLSGIETGATADQDLSSYQLQPSEGAFANGDKTKLDGIEASADVTDATNVTAAGALMDSEVTNLAQVKAFDSADYATAAQGTKADSAQQPPSEGAFVNGDKTKLDGIEASADVTDTANVTAAGALMDSEVDADIKTLSLPASTTISTFGASLVDDADAAAGRTTLGVDAAGTDNSTNVTLTGSGTYLSLAGQAITVDPITESDISDLGTYLTAEADTLDTVTGRGATTTNGVTVGSIDINGEIIEKAVNTTSVTGSTALDPANGTIQRLTFSGAVTFTDSLADGESITLHIDDGTAYAATWPTMEWVGGSAPTLDTTNEHIIVIWKVNSTLYGMASGVAS